MFDSNRFLLFGAIGVGVASIAYIFYGPSPNSAKNRKKKNATVTGLMNNGNQCFINAVLQSLASCKSLITWLQKFPQPSTDDDDEIKFESNVKRNRFNFLNLNQMKTTAMKTNRPKTSLNLAKHLSLLLKSLNQSDNSTEKCNLFGILYNIINEHWPAPHGEQDAHELFNLITANLETELYAALPMNSLRDALLTTNLLESPTSTTPLSPSNSITIKRRGSLQVLEDDRPKSLPFRGLFASQLQCKQCSHKYPVRLDTFYSVSLVIPNTVLFGGPILLQDCLNKLISNEIVHEVTCEGCSKTGRKASFVTRLTFAKLPQLLCFHFKRLVWLHNGTPSKRTEHIHFPEFLTMDDYVYTLSKSKWDTNKSSSSNTLIDLMGGTSTIIDSHTVGNKAAKVNQTAVNNDDLINVAGDVGLPQPNNMNRFRYRLCSVIVHIGDALSGHFIAYRRGGQNDQHWYYVSDMHVKRVTSKKVFAATAYMLFYERIKN